MNPTMESSSSDEEGANSPQMSPANSDTCLLDQDTYFKFNFFKDTFDQTLVDDCSNSSESSNGNGNNGGGVNFFEGAEKRLVLYLGDNNNQQNDNKAKGIDVAGRETKSLRTISRASWESMLNLVNCQVLNVISNEHYDAYLLSESSMFVSRDRVIIKTCGTTTLLHCLERMLQLVRKAGFDSIEDIFYSHKNLLVPSMQMHPHHSFLRESEFLDKMFTGLSHLFGHVNSDRFYLYTLDNNYNLSHSNEHWRFEIIMEQLDSAVMDLFIRPTHNGVVNESITAAEITRKSGIDKLVPGMIIDDFLFSPCGYSMNGLLGKYYMTIHITPEPGFSYVSVEVNVPQTNYPSFIRKIVNLFKPGKFLFTLMAPDLRKVAAKAKEPELQSEIEEENEFADIHGLLIYEDILGAQFDKFRRCDLQLAHYKHSDVIYARYGRAEGIS